MSGKGENKNEKKRDPIAMVLTFCHLLYWVAGAVVLGAICWITFTYEVDERYVKHFKPKENKDVLRPERGDILAQDGRLLAMSTPMYQVSMDCTVRKKEFRNKPDSERVWMANAKKLSEGLAGIYGGKTASEYYSKIRYNRQNNRQNMPIGGKIDYVTLQKVKALPLFNRGRFKGGIKIEKFETRQYPYGDLARRTIGYIRDQEDGTRRTIGLEGKFDYALHGKEGFEWTRTADDLDRIHNYGKDWEPAQNGYDIRTTLDIDLQDIADRALREQIADNRKIKGGCVVIMEVETGAIRAMVNLMRDSTRNRLYEGLNLAISQANEPGSVFKTASLMSLLEDGAVHSLQEEIPTNHGLMKYYSRDDHILDYERETKKNTMSILHGFEISSNYMFRKLVIDQYGENPQKFIDQLYNFKLGEEFQFDIDGLASPYLPKVGGPTWSGTDLGQVAIGYNVKVTPLHTLTFYNAIANKGKMQKPYLVESIEKNGKVIESFKPKVLSSRICSKSTADTLTRALKSVTNTGTARWNLKNAACTIAGKTGTSRIAQGSHGYKDANNRYQYQGTFVGFFPADEPRYSAIVVLWSYPGSGTIYGGVLPAKAFRSIVDKTYVLDSRYGEVLGKKGAMPKLRKKEE